MMFEDKLLHGIVGLCLGIFFARALPPIVSILLVWLICIGYEAMQLLTGAGTPEILDAVVGCAFGTLGWYLALPLKELRLKPTTTKRYKQNRKKNGRSERVKAWLNRRRGRIK